MADKDGKEDPLLLASRDGLRTTIELESAVRTMMLDDLRFCTLDQWPAAIRSERENDPNGARPCLTIDKINQYIVQVVNDFRQNRPAVKVRPVDGGADVETAKVFQGLVRHIEDQSSADIAYETALESAVRVGLGYFRVLTDYAGDSGFEQTIKIARVPNTMGCYLGQHLMPDGSDAKEGWIFDQIPMDEFKRRWPKAAASTADFDQLPAGAKTFWYSDKEYVTVCEYFYVEESEREYVALEDGTSGYADEIGEEPASPVANSRMQTERKVRWCIHSGIEILEKRDWAGKYIPIVEMIGREAFVDGKRQLWGLVRPSKDSLRMYNYWASTMTEKMALAPKAPFIGAVGQFATASERWKQANRVNYATLEYDAIEVNGNAVPPPKRQEPTQMEAAIIGAMQIIEHDVQTSLGMFKASVGESESQQSGRAILALQRESDTSTFHFHDNASKSIRHLGRILVDLIPKVMDTRRVVRILGEDDEANTVTLNPEQEQAKVDIDTGNGIKSIYNLGVGTYDVTITTGPSYNTKRMEAAAVFSELAKGASDPASAAAMRYLTVKNSDFTNSDEATKVLKALLPPPALQALSDDGPIPPKAQAAMAQMQQQGQMMAEKLREVTEENQKLQSGAQAKMAQVQVEAQAGQQELSIKAQLDAQKMAFERQMAEQKMALEVWKAEQDANLARMKCEHDAALANQKAESEHQHRAQEQQFKMQEKADADSGTAMPQFVQALTEISQAFAQALAQISAQNQQGMMAIAQALKEPKQVAIGGLQRGPDGNITGANMRVN